VLHDALFYDAVDRLLQKDNMSAPGALGLLAVQGELARYSRAADADPLSAGLQRDVALSATNCTLTTLTSNELGLTYNYVDLRLYDDNPRYWRPRPDIDLNSWGAWLVNTVKPPPVCPPEMCFCRHEMRACRSAYGRRVFRPVTPVPFVQPHT
jgi:hypothetical protein